MMRSNQERGYALLAVMFLGLLLALAAATASLSSLTEGRRQREDEMIWRGNQYVRAIQLYYRKNGRFPKDLEDLTKIDPGQPRFLRKVYKDPMNKEDGSWRLIYMGPGGQLFGSVMHSTLTGFTAQTAQGAQGGAQSLTNAPQGATAAPGAVNSGPAGQNPAPSAPANPESGTAGNGTIVEGQMVGGSLVGVASKVKNSSIKVFQDGHSYFEWEFIWNPTAGASGGTVIPSGAEGVGGGRGPQAPGGPGGPGGLVPPTPPAPGRGPGN